MKILLVNKFLFERGGAEAYVFRLGNYFSSIGHEVQFFGMEDKRNIVGNEGNVYVKSIDFHKKSAEMLLYPFRIIYSLEARRKMRRIIKLFKPNIVHLNNFNYQITPSIIYEIRKHNIPIVYTAHDYQLICPNHMLYQPKKGIICEECITSGFTRCVLNNCIHGSKFRSILGFFESALYHGLNTYSLIDKVICPSEFMERKILSTSCFQGKTVMMHNPFQKAAEKRVINKKNYVIYFGRFSIEKGIRTLINVCSRLPEIQFVFAGEGPLEHLVKGIPNIKNAGFLTGDDLKKMISEARFSIYPSEWYENNPFSVIESITYGTPVIGAEIGGIPEIIKNGNNGLLFQSANADDLTEKILMLRNNHSLLEEMTKNCLETKFETPECHGQKLFDLYKQAANRE